MLPFFCCFSSLFWGCSVYPRMHAAFLAFSNIFDCLSIKKNNQFLIKIETWTKEVRKINNNNIKVAEYQSKLKVAEYQK